MFYGVPLLTTGVVTSQISTVMCATPHRSYTPAHPVRNAVCRQDVGTAPCCPLVGQSHN